MSFPSYRKLTFDQHNLPQKATASDEPAPPEADLFLLCMNYGTVIKSYWSLPIPSAFMAVS